MSSLGKQFKIIGHDFDPDGGTYCPKCKKHFEKKHPGYFDGYKETPIYKHEMEAKDPKPRDRMYYISCNECGKDIWGKPDIY